MNVGEIQALWAAIFAGISLESIASLWILSISFVWHKFNPSFASSKTEHSTLDFAWCLDKRSMQGAGLHRESVGSPSAFNFLATRIATFDAALSTEMLTILVLNANLIWLQIIYFGICDVNIASKVTASKEQGDSTL
jgi:hypothetical protein